MNNESLFSRIKKLVATERRIGVEILECLSEIEKRKAYAELKYDGLFTYCVKELSFTESQAFQRIQAMRALKEVPEIKPMIESGSLSVSAVSKVQSHFRHERKKGTRVGIKDKLDLFRTIENCTSKEVEAKLHELRGEKLKVKLEIELDEEAVELWKRVQNLAAHKTQSDVLRTFKLITETWLEKNDPAREPKREIQHTVSWSTQVAERNYLSNNKNTRVNSKKPFKTRYITKSVRREIFRRDQGKCQNCGSKHRLEIDHILPYAKNGTNMPENLRVLCHSCNQFMGVQIFGTERMRPQKAGPLVMS